MNDTQTRKNLVIIHLESISNTILWQYRVEMGTVWRLMQGSHRFTHYNATATSTGMVMWHLWRGASSIFDHLYKFGAFTENQPPYNATIFESLEPEYKWRSYGLTRLGQMRNTATMLETNNQNEMLRAVDTDIKAWIAANTPFAIWFQPDISHMAFDDEVKIRAATFSERFRLGYRQLDALINKLMGILIQNGLWENTLIVGYGDHGDELWSHALTKGYCHAIAPYASMVRTPLFIYDNGLSAGDDDRLVGGADFRDTILGRLIPGFEPTEAMTAALFTGFDIEKQQRNIVFSQNLFAMQMEYSDYEQALKKGYAATDGVYRLVVTSGGKRPKEGGLELFCDQTDPGNNRNLLDFFLLDFEGNITGYRPPPEAVSADFTLTFSPEAVQGIIVAYQTLKKELHDYIRAKEAAALPYSAPQRHVMPESAFKQARKRLCKDYDE